MWKAVSNLLAEQFGFYYEIKHKNCLKKHHHAEIWLIDNEIQPVVVKLNEKSYRSMFRAQADQLELLAKTTSLAVPQVYGVGCCHNQSFLLLQGLQLQPANVEQLQQFAQQLAHQHQWHPQEKYGLDFDTWLGEVYQPNEWHSNWAKFFSEQRIGWQLQLCKEKQIIFGDIAEIIEKVEQKLAKHQPRPALLHGNLKPANFAWATDLQQMVSFDPACYWGDYECDLALIELTHPHAQQIIASYQQIQPLEAGYQKRKMLYQLYYLLNFSQRFQGEYIAQAQQRIEQLFEE